MTAQQVASTPIRMQKVEVQYFNPKGSVRERERFSLAPSQVRAVKAQTGKHRLVRESGTYLLKQVVPGRFSTVFRMVPIE